MDLKYMDIAFKNAKRAFKLGEVPIGAVIVKNDIILAESFNFKEHDKSVCSHAELLAIIEASKKLDNWRLDDCDIYVTLDPCPMCASAIKQSRIKNVYSALENSYSDNKKIIEKIFSVDSTNNSVNYISNLYVDKSKKLLNTFFEMQRNK